MTATPLRRGALGPGLMVLAALCFALMVACVKVARAELSAMEIVFWRSLVGLPLAALALGRGPWRIVNRPVFALRATLGVGAMWAYYTAARGLELADLSLIGRLQPVAVSLLAPLALGAGERAAGRTWGLLLAGLLGCGILLGPDLAVGSRYGGFALLAVACSAGAHTALRGLARTDNPRSVVFGFQVVALGVSAVAVFWRAGGLSLPPAHLVPWLLGVALFAVAGQLLITRAYQEDQAARVSAASHISPVWAVILDVVVFSAWPGWNVWLGGAVVMAAALALMARPDTSRRP